MSNIYLSNKLNVHVKKVQVDKKKGILLYLLLNFTNYLVDAIDTRIISNIDWIGDENTTDC